MVKTSVLSSRWRSLWLWVPRLELSWCHFFNFIAFRSFGNMFFDSNRVSNIHKLKLRLDANGEYYLKSWIDSVVKRKIQRLHVRQARGIHFCEMPLSLYVCETLVSLKLHKLTLVNPEFVSLPCLKILHLKNIVYATERPLLRDLSHPVMS
ncbi:putative F-box/FBD/LRR-repeat protein [Cardamine amara subsp. amara]|uniref:F-box/FBD/LRR-repeat protein n=1 Tax=Cardamine amara subsp. amara TaxID=228776 RepID=A0ABD1ATG0_CARAN